MRFPPWLGIAGAVALACLAFGATYKYAGSVPAHFFSEAIAAEPASSHVRVVTAVGHGSGTHIGGGYIVTAGHVAAINQKLTVVADNGTEYEAEVLWSNSAKDVALLRLKAPSTLAKTELLCEDNFTGQRVRAFGNPRYLQNVYTRGEVIGAAFTINGGGVVIPVDITAAPGMSGGGMIDDQGRLVAVLVSGMGNGFAFTFGVPATVICDLMGRTA